MSSKLVVKQVPLHARADREAVGQILPQVCPSQAVWSQRSAALPDPPLPQAFADSDWLNYYASPAYAGALNRLMADGALQKPLDLLLAGNSESCGFFCNVPAAPPVQSTLLCAQLAKRMLHGWRLRAPDPYCWHQLCAYQHYTAACPPAVFRLGVFWLLKVRYQGLTRIFAALCLMPKPPEERTIHAQSHGRHCSHFGFLICLSLIHAGRSHVQ